MDTQTGKPRLIGEYLPCSRTEIQAALRKKRDAMLHDRQNKRVGALLLESNVITKEELNSALIYQRADRLKLCPGLSSLSQTEVFTFSKYFAELSLQAEQTFIMEGEDDPTLYMLVSGQVETFRIDSDSNKVHIMYTDPVALINETGYFQGGARSFSVRTKTPAELLLIPYKDLSHYFERTPRVAHIFLDIVKARASETQ